MSITQIETFSTTATAPGRQVSTVMARIGWGLVWAMLTAFVVFEVASHGGGSSPVALLLAGVSVVAFIAPDLTFLTGVGTPMEKGLLPRRAVRFYNAAHHFWVPLILTSVVGVAFAPLTTATLAIFVAGLSWMAHIAMDRTFGYGLRNSDGSQR